MSKSLVFLLFAFGVLSACKTSTNPLEGQKLRLISSDPDTTSVHTGPVDIAVTVLDNSGYGVSGAYIDFYDPIERRARHEGPTPVDGTFEFTDTVPITFVGTVKFGFVAEHSGSTSSDSLRLWVNAIDIRPWVIDTVQANGWSYSQIGVRWSRPPMDKGIDTVFVLTPNGFIINPVLVPYPLNSAVVYVSGNGVDTISVHNAYYSSQPILWATPYYVTRDDLYPLSDSNQGFYSGFSLAAGYGELVNSNTDYYIDFLVANDPDSHSGLSIVSPSLYVLSGFLDGKVTAFYHPVSYIDSGAGLDELYYSNDLSNYVTGATPLYKIPLPDSSRYSTAFLAVTSTGNYAQISAGPITHDWAGRLYVPVQVSYQETPNLPYAGRGRHR